MAIRTGVSLVLLVGSLSFYVGCGQSQTVLQHDSTGQFAAAVQLYGNGCVTCHGDNLQGGIGPSLQHVGTAMTVAQLVHQIDVGGGPMPGYGPTHQAILTPAQIETLASWLSTKK